MRIKERIVGCLLVLLANAACGAETVPVTPPADTPAIATTITPAYAQPFVIIPGQGPQHMAIPVNVTGKMAATALCLEKLGVRYQGSASVAVSEHFAIDGKLFKDGDITPQLRFTLQNPVAMAPGEYQVLVRFYDCAKPQESPVAQPAYAFSIPYAKLEAPGKQIIDLRLPAPWSAARLVPATITIDRQNDTAHVPIRSPVLSSETFTNSDGRNVGGARATKLATVAPYLPIKFDLLPQDFPPGTAVGHFMLRSPDLQQPFKIEMEMHTRLHPAWLVVMIVAGFLLGQLLRRILQGRIALGESRQLALDALTRYQREREDIADAGYRAAAGVALSKLYQVVRTGNKTQVDAAVTAARTAVDKAQADLQAALDKVSTCIADYGNAFNVAGSLPRQFADICRAVEQDVAACVALVTANDATGAREELVRRSGDAVTMLSEAMLGLRSDSETLHRELAHTNLLLTPAQRLDVARAGDAFHAALEDITAVMALTEVNAALKRVLQMQFLGTLLRNRYAVGLEQSASEVDSQVERRAPPAAPLPPLRAAFRQKLASIAAGLHRQAKEQPFLLLDWSTQVPDAASALRAALSTLITSRTDLAANAAALLALANGDQWYDLFDQISEFNPTLHELTAVTSSPAPSSAPIPSLLLTEPARKRITAPQVRLVTLPEITLAALHNRNELRWSRLLMAFGTGTIMVLASYACYADKFVGTNLELLGLFVWGFSADMTLSGLMEKLPSMKSA